MLVRCRSRRISADFRIRMRALLVFLLATPVFADDIPLREVRAWQGEISVESRGEPGKAGSGAEVQKEKVTFVALTDPRRTVGARERLELRLRRTEGSWSLDRWSLESNRRTHSSGGSGSLSRNP